MFASLASSNIITCIVGMTTFWLLLGLFTRFRRRTPPGPWGFPLLGCLPHLIFTKKSIRTVFQNWYFKYGPIYSLRLGTANVVVLCDYRSVKEALVRPEFQERARLDFLLDRAGAGMYFEVKTICVCITVIVPMQLIKQLSWKFFILCRYGY